MKTILFFSIMCFSLECNTLWKLGSIYNNSDLALDSVWYIRPKEKQINTLTNIIQQAKGKKIIPLHYTVSDTSKGCCLIKAQDNYRISFDGNPAHAIRWARTKTSKNSKKQVGKEYCKVGAYCARVFIEKGSGKDIKPIAYTAHEYTSENYLFDIVLSGNNGSYAVKLVPKIES